MKWLVKILAVMLVLCILLTLLVACKKNSEESEGEEEETNNSSGGTKQDIKSSIEDNEDLDGENHYPTDDTLDAGQFNN